MIKTTLVAIMVFGLSGHAFAVNKCKDSNGKLTYQEKACDVAAAQSDVKVWSGNDSGAESPAKSVGSKSQLIDSVTLQEATIVISRIGESKVKFTYDAKWKNDNPTQVEISYKIHYFDSQKTEIGQSGGRRTFVAPRWVATSSSSDTYGDSKDRFDYKKVASAVVHYKIAKEETEKKFTNVSIRN